MRILGKVLIVAGLLLVGVGLGAGLDRGTKKNETKKTEAKKKGVKQS